MFKKPLPLGNRSALGGKERKKIRNELFTQFPKLTDADMNLLIPPKEEIVLLKLQNTKCCIYLVNEEPILFDCDGKNDLFPSVYALWKVPKMMPSFVIHPHVSQYVLGGADLMLPGILTPNCGFKAQYLTIGRKWAVRVLQCELPFAVGRTMTSALSIEASGMKGKALSCLHYLGDQLWQKGSKFLPLVSFTVQCIHQPTIPCDEPEFSTLIDSLRGISSDDVVNNHLEVGAQEVEVGAQEVEGLSTQEIINLNDAKRTDNINENIYDSLEWDHANDRVSSLSYNGIVDQSHPIELMNTNLKLLVIDGESPDHIQGVASKSVPETNTDITVKDVSDDLPSDAEEEQEALGTDLVDQLTTDQVDFLLQTCLMEALHTSVVDTQLPLDSSALFSKCLSTSPYVLRHLHVLDLLEKAHGLHMGVIPRLLEKVPPTAIVDIQRSSYKKSPKLIDWATKAHWIESKKHRNVRIITNVKRRHPSYVAHIEVPVDVVKRVVENEDSKQGERPQGVDVTREKGKAKEGPVVTEYYRLLGGSRSILTAIGKNGPSPEHYMSREEALKVLNTYIQNVLPIDAKNKDEVRIDATLAVALSLEENTTVTRSTLSQSYLSRLEVYHSITNPDGGSELPKINRGRAKPIMVLEEVRQKRKYITSVTQLEPYYVDAKFLAEILAKRVAASASVFDIPTSKAQQKSYGVAVQGKVADAVITTLVEVFGISEKSVEIKRKLK